MSSLVLDIVLSSLWFITFFSWCWTFTAIDLMKRIAATIYRDHFPLWRYCFFYMTHMTPIHNYMTYVNMYCTYVYTYTSIIKYVCTYKDCPPTLYHSNISYMLIRDHRQRDHPTHDENHDHQQTAAHEHHSPAKMEDLRTRSSQLSSRQEFMCNSKKHTQFGQLHLCQFSLQQKPIKPTWFLSLAKQPLAFHLVGLHNCPAYRPCSGTRADLSWAFCIRSILRLWPPDPWRERPPIQNMQNAVDPLWYIYPGVTSEGILGFLES